MNYLLPHLIDQSAGRFPEKEAFRCGKEHLTYFELSRKTNQLAHLLVELGVKRGDRIGIYLRRSLETAIAIYGIMKAGAAYVPLDPDAPGSRTKFLLEDCGIDHLISDRSQIRGLNDIMREDIKLKTIIGLSGEFTIKTVSWDELAQYPSQNGPAIKILEQDLAYVMYTSGSTGEPKGIMHTHYSGLSYARLAASQYQLVSDDRIANHAPMHFDISTLGFFSGPLVGATTVIIPEAHTKMPASLSQLMEKEKLTIWYSVPLALVQLLNQGLLEQRDMSSIRWVLFAGEPFSTRHLKSLMLLWPHAAFSNIYGPAEVNQCTYYNLTSPPDFDTPIPIGSVWENTEIMIIDEDGEEVTNGQQGELLVRSVTMMKGYWKKPKLTKNSFYICRDEGGFERIFYKTGDLVQLNAAGELLFQGRKDRQIKTRGYRVELDEVEAVLLGNEAVTEAAVFSVYNEGEGLLIEAAIILKNDCNLSEKELQDYAGIYLSSYALPHKINFVSSLPHTSNGKIDRVKLQEEGVEFIENKH